MAEVSIVVPAYNEARAVGDTVRRIAAAFDGSEHAYEILVVDDGSQDGTARAAELAGAGIVRHPINIGYGNSLLTGIRQARYPLVAITDADGTYPVEELPAMAAEVQERGLDMLVGRRTGCWYHGSLMKSVARFFFKCLAEYTCGRAIPDINSGLRVMRRDLVMQAANVLCGGFSFTTTLTIIAFMTNHFVAYRDITYHRRVGASHVRYFRDTLRSLQILLMTILIFNPIKLYLLLVGVTVAFGMGAAGVCALWPTAQGACLVGTLSFATAMLLLAQGFAGDQRRVIAQAGKVIARRAPTRQPIGIHSRRAA